MSTEIEVRELTPLERCNRTSTDRLYMINELVKLLGPKARALYERWQREGVQRIHFSWDPSKPEVLGEERADLIESWESAPRRIVVPGVDVDSNLNPISVDDFLDEEA